MEKLSTTIALTAIMFVGFTTIVLASDNGTEIAGKIMFFMGIFGLVLVILSNFISFNNI